MSSPTAIFALFREHGRLELLLGLSRTLTLADKHKVSVNNANLILGLLEQFCKDGAGPEDLDPTGLAILRKSAGRSRGESDNREQTTHVPVDVLHLLLLRERKSAPRATISLARLLRRIAATEAFFQSTEEDAALWRQLSKSRLHDQLLSLSETEEEFDEDDDTTAPPIGTDLVAQARQGYWLECPLALDHDTLKRQYDAFKRLVTILRSETHAPLLLADAGVGKSAFVEGLAYHVARNPLGLLSENERCWRIIEISAADLLAGTQSRGSLEGRLNELIDMAGKGGDTYLYFDEMHVLFDTTNDEARRIANTLKPKLARGLQCLAATTKDDFHKHVQADAALESRFFPIEIPLPTRGEAISILGNSKASILGGKGIDLGIDYDIEAIGAAVDLSERFRPNHHLPRKAIDPLKAAVQEKIDAIAEEDSADPVSRSIAKEDVARVYATYTGISVDYIIDPTDESRFLAMRKQIKERLFGQDHVVDAVIDQVRLHAKRFSTPNRPAGVFLFLGSPGVGKSELARLLATFALPEPSKPIIQDMSLYSGNDEMAITKLIGSSAGFVGYREPTVFSRVRQNKGSGVVLLDEIEKAPAIYPILLSVFTGYAEDACGEGTSFEECLIILTSNALRERWGESQLTRTELAEMLVDESSYDCFPREFIDRIDDIFMFNYLTAEHLLSILRDQIANRETRSGGELPTDLATDPNRQRDFIESLMSAGNRSGRAVSRALDDHLRQQSLRS